MPHLQGGVDLTRGGQKVRCGRENGKQVEGGQETLRLSGTRMGKAGPLPYADLRSSRCILDWIYMYL